MKITKFLSVAAVFAFALIASAADIKDLSVKSYWNNSVGKARFEGGKIFTSGRTMLSSRTSFIPDPDKSYTVTMDVEAPADIKKTSLLLVGFIPCDENDRGLAPWHIQAIPGTFTKIAVDAKKGDTSIVVKDASKWKKFSTSYVVVNAKEDFSDIPNRSPGGYNVKKIEKSGENWVVTFGSAIKRDLPAGTCVRQHKNDGYFYVFGPIYFSRNRRSIKVRATVKGIDNYGLFNRKLWPKGAAKFRIVALFDWNNTKVNLTISNPQFIVE